MSRLKSNRVTLACVVAIVSALDLMGPVVFVTDGALNSAVSLQIRQIPNVIIAPICHHGEIADEVIIVETVLVMVIENAISLDCLGIGFIFT